MLLDWCHLGSHNDTELNVDVFHALIQIVSSAILLFPVKDTKDLYLEGGGIVIFGRLVNT